MTRATAVLRRILLCAWVPAALLLLSMSACAERTDTANGTSDTLATAQGTAEAGGQQTIAERIAAEPRFSTLATALDSAGLAETLRQDDAFTLFAPTDQAFDALPDGTLDELLQNPDRLRTILEYHLVRGENTTADFENMSSPLTMMDGSELAFSLSGDQLTLGSGQDAATVTEADLPARNGVIHAIDAVLMPPVGT